MKCHIVPTPEPCSPEVQALINAWLCKHLPKWANFTIAPFAKYLGIFMGPATVVPQWKSVIEKYLSVVTRIADSHASPHMSAHLYNTRAVPLLGYKAQFHNLPPEFPAIERRALLRILHLAGNSLDSDGFFNLESLNGPNIISCIASTSAALIRSASKTLPSWHLWVHPLRTTADTCLPLCFLESGLCSLPFWDTPPIALTLESAAAGISGCLIPQSAFIAEQLQKTLYKCIAPQLHINSLNDLLCKRIAALVDRCLEIPPSNL